MTTVQFVGNTLIPSGSILSVKGDSGKNETLKSSFQIDLDPNIESVEIPASWCQVAISFTAQATDRKTEGSQHLENHYITHVREFDKKNEVQITFKKADAVTTASIRIEQPRL